MGNQNKYTERTYQQGDVLFTEGDSGDELYIIRHGEVGVYQKDKEGEMSEIAVIGEGNVVGEMALFDNSPRSATVRCKRITRVISINRTQFMAQVEKMPIWLSRIVKIVTQRLRTTNKKLKALANRDFSSNLARLLAYMISADAKEDAQGIYLDEEHTTDEIHKILNIDYDVIETIYIRLVHKKLMTVRNNKIRVPNPELLISYADYARGDWRRGRLPDITERQEELLKVFFQYAEKNGRDAEGLKVFSYETFCEEYKTVGGMEVKEAELEGLVKEKLISRSQTGKSASEENIVLSFNHVTDVLESLKLARVFER